MNDETQRLLEKFRTGDDGALEELFTLHRPRLATAVRRRFGLGSNDLDDLVQTALLRAFRNLDKFQHRHEGSFLAWLYSTAAFEWQRLLRHEQADRRDRRRSQSMDADSRRGPISDETTPSQRLAGEELQQLVYQLIEQLPDQQRRAMQLSSLMGLETEELRIELGLANEAAVRALLSRSKARLAKLLEQHRQGEA